MCGRCVNRPEHLTQFPILRAQMIVSDFADTTNGKDHGEIIVDPLYLSLVKHIGVHMYSSDNCAYFGERSVPIGVICREIFVSTEPRIDRVLS
jgi:hypothetical protein